jgi:hypothetical protein
LALSGIYPTAPGFFADRSQLWQFLHLGMVKYNLPLRFVKAISNLANSQWSGAAMALFLIYENTAVSKANHNPRATDGIGSFNASNPPLPMGIVFTSQLCHLLFVNHITDFGGGNLSVYWLA